MKKETEIMGHTHSTSITPKVRKRWVRPAILFSLIFFGVSLGLYLSLRLIGYVGDNYTLLFPKIVEVKIRPPVIFVKKADIDPTLMIEEEIDRQLKEIKITPTPTTKPRSNNVVKPVQASGSYKYPNYSNRPHYDKIIAGVKARYPNWEVAAELIAREGMFQPEIKNHTSGACGLPQALPCSKMKCALDETGIDCQLDWMNNYVINRYGSIDKALAFRISKGWY